MKRAHSDDGWLVSGEHHAPHYRELTHQQVTEGCDDMGR